MKLRLLALLLLALAPGARAGQKNVLLIVTDQHSARTVGAYGNGFGGVNGSLTPRIDALAAEGARFERAYCSAATCRPSRLSILTGRYPHDHGLRHNGIWAPRGIETFPRLARSAGYVTATIGKHHMRWLEQPDVTDDFGFTEIVDMADYLAFCAAAGQPTWQSPGHFRPVEGLPAELVKTGYSFASNEFHPAGFFADRAIEFLEERAGDGGDGQPFALWYAPFGPHTPLLPTGPGGPIDWAHLYHPFDGLGLPPNLDKVATTDLLSDIQHAYAGVTDDQWREVLAHYYGLITQVDWNIGRVLDRLEALGLSGDTLVVYASDHGEMASEMSCWTKGTGNYDAITRVPLVARLPRVLPEGRVIGELVSLVDLFPTMLEVTGVPVGDATLAGVAGRSLLDLSIEPQPPADWRREAYCEQGFEVGKRNRMVRTKRSKYAFDERNGGEEEFYDLITDPFEIDNRIADPTAQAEIALLRARLDTLWNDEVGHAPLYELTGPSDATPARASQPSPPDSATGVARNVDPSWLPATSAETQIVYFGVPGHLVPVRELAAMEASFNPGTLDPDKTYLWRVDSVNANGTRTGDEWEFRTAPGGSGGPGLARNPLPVHAATDVDRSAQLAWQQGSGATAQRIFFGTADGPLTLLSPLPPSASSYDPGTLLAGVTYQWRVDQVSPAGTTVGDVWQFTTSPDGLPERASAIVPLHLDESVTVSTGFSLRWTPGAGATSYDVFLGTAQPPELVGETTAHGIDPGPLQPGETYYWRVDGRNAAGTIRGWTWRFTVEP